MKMKLKLYATLAEFLPADAEDNAALIDVDAAITAHGVLDRFHVPRERAHLVLCNGVFVPPGARDEAAYFQEGDVLAVWPPVAGG